MKKDFPKEAVEKLIKLLDGKVEDKSMNENKTLDNLMEAFAGEAQANRKYLAYAKRLKKRKT